MAPFHLKISEKWKRAKSEESKMGNSCSFGGTKKQKLPQFVPVGLRQYFSFSSIPWFHFFLPRLVKNQKKRSNLRWFQKNIFWCLRRGQNLSLVFILGVGWIILYQDDKIQKDITAKRQKDTISSIFIINAIKSQCKPQRAGGGWGQAPNCLGGGGEGEPACQP